MMNPEEIKVVHKTIEKILRELLKGDNLDFELIEKLANEFVKLGSFTPVRWDMKEVRKWEDSLRIISQKPYSKEILGVLVDIEAKASLEKKEPLQFLMLEMRTNIFNDSPSDLIKLKELTITYPHNLLFYLYYGTYIGGEHDVEKIELELVCKKTLEFIGFTVEPDNYNLSGAAVSVCLRLLHKYMELHEFEKAVRLQNEISEVALFKKHDAIANIIYDMKFTIMQSKAQYELIESTVEEFRKEIELQSEDARKKGFEQLVIFTAVITFLITAANSISSASFPVVGIGVLGYTLLTFVLAILMCLEKPISLRDDNRFRLLIGSSIIAILIAISSVVTKIESICVYNCGPVTQNIEVINVLPNFFEREESEVVEITPPWEIE